jgi:excisionase family DNA binding protein
MRLATEKLPQLERYMTVDEVSQLLYVSRDTVVRYWKRNVIPSNCGIQMGDVIRFDPRAVSDWLLNGELPEHLHRHPGFPDTVIVDDDLREEI